MHIFVLRLLHWAMEQRLFKLNHDYYFSLTKFQTIHSDKYISTKNTSFSTSHLTSLEQNTYIKFFLPL